MPRGRHLCLSRLPDYAKVDMVFQVDDTGGAAPRINTTPGILVPSLSWMSAENLMKPTRGPNMSTDWIRIFFTWRSGLRLKGS